uniref:substrate-binding domain-containing protein n=1 Tax=Promineifilum sp. TaxID=2664178 RepID=UPI0035B26DC7
MSDEHLTPRDPAKDLFPQGDEVNRQVSHRRRMGTVWRAIFFGATALAILILSILLLKIIGDANGYVVEESEMPEAELILSFNRDRVLNAPNVALSGEDDMALAEGVAGDPNGLGFVPYAAYQANADSLTLVAVDGHLPTAETVQSGEYPAARPLLLYSSPAILDDKPQVLAFLIYYLAHVDEAMAEVGYFPADAAQLSAQAATLAETLGLEALPAVNPADYEGAIKIAGSSTIFPLTQAIADRFIADGFRGSIELDGSGTTAGFQAMCVDRDSALDIVSASRSALATELAACRIGRPLQALLVAQDALSIVVNPANTAVTNVSRAQLIQLFTTAETWADVDEAWPAAVIARYLPSAGSGTLDFFADTVFTQATLADLAYDDQVAMYQANVSAGRCRAVEYEQRFYGD